MNLPGASTRRISGQARLDMARDIHARRESGMTRQAIASELRITHGQIDAILSDFPWVPATSPASGGTTAECPACDLEVPVRSGRLDYHDGCDGSGLPLGALP